MNKTIIYTDGACSGNPGNGGWAFILIQNGNKKKDFGHEPNTTNNRMELKAVIEGIQSTEENKIEIYTDSKYVKDGIEVWILQWKKNGWKTSAKKDVKNKDLWLKLDEAIQNKEIVWKWVKGHASDELNNEVDKLARNAIQK